MLSKKLVSARSATYPNTLHPGTFNFRQNELTSKLFPRQHFGKESPPLRGHVLPIIRTLATLFKAPRPGLTSSPNVSKVPHNIDRLHQSGGKTV